MSRLDREPFYTPVTRDVDFPETWEGGHALIIQYGDCEFIAHCQCGAWLANQRPHKFDPSKIAGTWENHCMNRDDR